MKNNIIHNESMQYFNNSIVEENGARFDLGLTLAIAHNSYFLDHVCISLTLLSKLPVEKINSKWWTIGCRLIIVMVSWLFQPQGSLVMKNLLTERGLY